MKNKYYNDAIIGSKDIKATLSEKGELLRLYYPHIDFRQFIDEFMVGIKVNDSRLIKLNNDINNMYEQKYIEDTNILNTEILNTYFNIDIHQTDYVSIKEKALVRKYRIINKNNISLNVNLLIHSTLLSSPNNNVSGIFKEDSLIQYMHDYSLAIFSKSAPLSYQINNSKETIDDGKIFGKDYVGTSRDSSISYDIGKLDPEEEKEIEIIIAVYDNSKYSSDQILQDIRRIKKIDFKQDLLKTKNYWKKYVANHNKIIFPENKSELKDKIEKIYKRTILLYPLLINYETGGISAAVEIDEDYSKSGRYSYCWPRDALQINKAMEIIGMDKEIEKFYKVFCNKTQEANGMWEQRFYTDGVLAPAWGYQVDETSSVICGVYDHYVHSQNINFLKDNLKMCEKGCSFLIKYIDDIIHEKNKMQLSYDLWENIESIHAYSLASIFAAFNAMIKIYEKIKILFENNRLKIEKINKEIILLNNNLIEVKKFIIEKLYDKEKKCFRRNTSDEKIDISLLGLSSPFKVFSPKEKSIQNTVEKINMTLRTYTGGYLRYEGDNYIGGNNPWIIANLWMANYYLDIGNKRLAKECFKFTIMSANKHGFLPEQINNKTMEPWVIGLGWSHAMFIEVLSRLFK